ncbi:MAG: cytochrome P450 [Caldilinea sp. CFX5]|nr:cytochrome P450 [Caldilinea sp. CFX5]
MANARDANIVDPDVYVQGVPHATFKRLRDEDPVSWWPEAQGSGFWAVTRYADLIEVSHQPKLFSNAQGIRLEEMDAEELIARQTMMELDPPEHTAQRRLVNPPFLPRAVATYSDELWQLARAVIDNVRGKAEFDFVTEVARTLPMRMLGKLLGVSDEEGRWLVRAGDALIGNTDPEFTDFPVDQVDTQAFRLMPFRSPVSQKLFDYAGEQRAIRQRCPAHDLITRLTEPMKDGAVLSDLEFKNFFTLMVAAGNDTTRYTMAAGMEALIQRPHLLRELQSNPQLLASATEEILRWGSVTMHFRRTATQDYELNGRLIHQGDKVVIWYISANFDERQFPDPFTFDITRTPNDHVAFGLKGPHKCLGEHLARLEIQLLFAELLPQIKTIRLHGPVERLRSNFIAGIKHLPVLVEWA